MSASAFWYKILASLMIWLTVAGFSVLFSALGHWEGAGAFSMVVAGLIVMWTLWYFVDIK